MHILLNNYSSSSSSSSFDALALSNPLISRDRRLLLESDCEKRDDVKTRGVTLDEDDISISLDRMNALNAVARLIR